jgi:GMP synthase-like glutamine amidotransferase
VVPEIANLPDPADIDCLMVMGGPMSAWDDGKYPWMRAEKDLIETMVRLGKPVLGVCLGAQLLAAVLGARTYRGEREEIGWFQVESTDSSRGDPVGNCLPKTFETFLWHGDSFDLPEGATHLARSETFAHQAFRCGSALALQFHLEARPDWVKRIAARDADQLTPSGSVQTVDRILSTPESVYRTNNRLMDRLLDAWMVQIASGED